MDFLSFTVSQVKNMRMVIKDLKDVFLWEMLRTELKQTWAATNWMTCCWVSSDPAAITIYPIG